MKRLVLIALCVVIPQPIIAATITWEAYGRISQTSQDGQFAPPPNGTPWSLELQFDSDLIAHTPYWPADAPCSMVPISGSFTLGGAPAGGGEPQPRASYTFGGTAFTNAMLPINNCGLFGYGTVQYFMFPRATADDPWNLWGVGGVFLLASYEDLDQNGTIPTVPAYSSPGYLVYRNDSFRFEASFSPHAVQQPVPVPEPATSMLLGLGFALMGGRQWRRRRTRS